MAFDTYKLNSKPVLYQIHSPQLSIHSTSSSQSSTATLIAKTITTTTSKHKQNDNSNNSHDESILTSNQQLLITSTVPINPASEHIQGTRHIHESGNSRLRRTFGRLCALHHTKLLTIGNKNDNNRNLSIINDTNKNLNSHNTTNSSQIIECNNVETMRDSQNSISYYV